MGWARRTNLHQFSDFGADNSAMTGILGRFGDGGWWRVLRYSAVSLAGIVFTQVLLVTMHTGIGMDASTANVVAVLTASVPVYAANRAWVWKLTGPSSIRREIVPFWAFTIVGLLGSTMAVAVVAAWADSAFAITAANVGSFGVLWIAKYLLLDSVIFVAEEPPEPCTEDLASILW